MGSMNQVNTDELKNTLKGQTLWLIGNGPSLKNIDLTFLKDKNTLCVNQFYLHPQFRELDINYYLIAHPSAFKGKEDGGDSNVLETAIEKSKDLRLQFLFPEKYASEFLEKNRPSITYAMWLAGSHIQQSEPLDIKNNAPRWAQNVFACSLMWGLYLGASDIRLLGFDNGGITTDPFEGHFYQPIGHEREILDKMTTQQFQRAMYVLLQQLHAIERYASENNQIIWNCNEESKIPIFPYAPRNLNEDFEPNKIPQIDISSDINRSPTQDEVENFCESICRELNDDFLKSYQGEMDAHLRIIHQGILNLQKYLDVVKNIALPHINCGLTHFWMGLILHKQDPQAALKKYLDSVSTDVVFPLNYESIYFTVESLDQEHSKSQYYRTKYWKSFFKQIQYQVFNYQMEQITFLEPYLVKSKDILWVSQILCAVYIRSNPQKLKNHCKQMIYQWPNHSVFYIGLAHYYLSINDFNEAQSYWTKAQVLDQHLPALAGQIWKGTLPFPTQLDPLRWETQQIKDFSKSSRPQKAVVPILQDFQKHQARRIFILGAEELISEQNLKALKDEIVISVGEFGQQEELELIQPDYHIIADPKSLDSSNVLADQKTLQTLKKFENLDTEFLFPYSYAKSTVDSTEFKKFNIKYFSYDSNFSIQSKINLSTPAPLWGQNVMNLALMLSFHLGCKEIYLLGFEHAGIAVPKVGLQNINENNLNSVFQKKVDQDEVDRCKYVQLNQLHEIREYCQIHKHLVFNCSQSGVFKMFPFCEFESLFPKLNIIKTKQASEQINKTFKTVPDVMEHWVTQDPTAECVSLWNNSNWEKHTRQEFWIKVEHYSELFASHCELNSLILFVKTTDIDLLSAYVGAMKAGLQPAQLSPFTSKISESEYHRKITHILEVTQATCVFTDQSSFEYLQNTGVKLLTKESVKGELVHKVVYSDIALAQFSSGSTGLQKAVFLKHSGIISHMDHYANLLEINPNDRLVSWLPLYHDMGLIACYLMPLMKGIPFMMMDAFHWLAKPQILIDTISEYKGTLCYLPNFAYHVLAKKCYDKDLSSMRAFVNCSEPAKPETHQIFKEHFRSVKPQALSVCYALAENTYAVSQTDLRFAPKEVVLNKVKLLSCGTIMENTKVQILEPDSQGVGEVMIQGACIFDRFLDNEDKMIDGFYPTGDLGFIHENELFITGRKKDLIIVNGKNIYPQDVEYVSSSVSGVYPGRVVCFGVENQDSGSQDLIVQVEPQESTNNSQLILRVQQTIELEIGLLPKLVEVVPYMSLVKTSSGKISRARNKELFEERAS